MRVPLYARRPHHLLWRLAREAGNATQVSVSAASRSTRVVVVILMVEICGGPGRLGTSPPVKLEGATCAPLV